MHGSGRFARSQWAILGLGARTSSKSRQLVGSLTVSVCQIPERHYERVLLTLVCIESQIRGCAAGTRPIIVHAAASGWLDRASGLPA